MDFTTKYKSFQSAPWKTDWLRVGDYSTATVTRDGEVVGTVTANLETWLVQVETGGDVHTISYFSRRGTEQSGRILAERLADYLNGEITK